MWVIPGSGRSPGEGHVNPLQYSSLENSMDFCVHLLCAEQEGELWCLWAQAIVYILPQTSRLWWIHPTARLTGQRSVL